MTDMYNTNLDKNHANFTPLSPLSFLQRSAEFIPIDNQLFMVLKAIHGQILLSEVSS